jgi:hypothetical protein
MVEEKERYKKIVMHPAAGDRLLDEFFLESYAEAPKEIVLDLGATDDPLYAHQEGRFFHGWRDPGSDTRLMSRYALR